MYDSILQINFNCIAYYAIIPVPRYSVICTFFNSDVSSVFFNKRKVGTNSNDTKYIENNFSRHLRNTNSNQYIIELNHSQNNRKLCYNANFNLFIYLNWFQDIFAHK